MEQNFALYAVTETNSGGRLFQEKSHSYRSDFERDRDRIIHSSAFRRLEGKTQVFTPGFDDNYRTRLTHSIEVAQIGRTIARTLRLNEPLTEAICLAHDLGHSPFGHCGEEIINKLMADHGGFEHNCQTIRIVELLEHPYKDFAGLNLLYETRLGLSRHRSPYDSPADDGFSEKNSSLEGQIANTADRIAYNCHDLEDGLRSRILDPKKLCELEVFARAWRDVDADNINDSFVRHTRIVKAIIDRMVSDAIDTSGSKLDSFGIASLEQVLDCSEDMIVLSDQAQDELRQLESYLLDNMYHSELLKSTVQKVSGWLAELFKRFIENPELMPRYYRRFIDAYGVERGVCDYVSGMTDRYCLKLLGRLE